MKYKLPDSPNAIRWWPAWIALVFAAGGITVIRLVPGSNFQERNLRTLGVCLVAGALLFLWWVFLSRLPWRRRGLGILVVALLLGLFIGLFHIRGVSGDLLPIVEFRWKARPNLPAAPAAVASRTQEAATAPLPVSSPHPDFAQYLGPNRDTTLTGIALDPDWNTHPPQVLWRQPVGAAWSGFVIVGERALTQEQQGESELVTCRELSTGKLLWSHADLAKYDTVIAGTGPRQTPVVVGERVYTQGATGYLNCLELATGRAVWSTNIFALAKRGTTTKDGVVTNVARLPDWGYAGTPLVTGGRVIVQPGGDAGRSLAAFDAQTGGLLWTSGDGNADYGSPTLLTLAGTPQVLIFSSRTLSSHDPATGRILWQKPFGTQFPLVANPLAIGPDRVLLSAGYGVGAELLEIKAGADNTWTTTNIWSSRRLKAKFHHPVRRGDYVYGLDDGMWACLALKDGSQPWKSGRYGHGQGLLIGEHYLLMAENGELILLQPAPEEARELARFRVFDRKTWNPIALAGEYLLVRNDEEAVLLKVALHR